MLYYRILGWLEAELHGSMFNPYDDLLVFRELDGVPDPHNIADGMLRDIRAD